MLIGRRQVVLSIVTRSSGSRPIMELTYLAVWALLVTLVTNAVIDLPGAAGATIDMEFSLTQGMPAINDKYFAGSSAGDSQASAGEHDYEKDMQSKFTIESEISQSTDYSNNKRENVKKSFADNTMLYIKDNMETKEHIPSPSDFNFPENEAKIGKDVEDKRTPSENSDDENDEATETPSIIPFVQEYEKSRLIEEDYPSENMPFTSMDFIVKKRSHTKKKSIKHVLKVTNDIIQPAVHRPRTPVRMGKRTSGIHSKSVSFQIDPNQGGASSGANIPKLNYNLKDLYYSHDQSANKQKRLPSTEDKEPESVASPSSVVTTTTTTQATTYKSTSSSTTKPSTTVVTSSSSSNSNTEKKENNSETSESSSRNDSVRSSDPQVVAPGLSDVGFDPNDIPQIPLGQIDTLDIDVPGEPLTPMDFVNAHNHVNEPIDTVRHLDPTTMAERFEGDIELVEADRPINKTASGGPRVAPQFRSAIVSSERLWPNGTVPYLISSTYKEPERAIIALALTNFHLVSCVRFVPRTNQRDYIHFLKGDGCSSNVGRIGGSQAVSLGPGCIHAGVVMHELMHALGFWHEQSRSDRDQHVLIHWENIRPGKGNNFLKYDFAGLKHVGRVYDLDSLMHYSQYAFARDRSLPTVEAISGTHLVGQRKGLSEKDSQRLRQLYPCPNATAPTIFPNINQPTVTLPPPTPGMCMDSDYHCPLWADVGECTQNAAWMKLNCRKSCKQCGIECQDLNTKCEGWKVAGECESNAPYMHLYCPVSCTMCPSLSNDIDNDVCSDKNDNCGKWAAAGNCEQYPGYMTRFCKDSCKRC